MEIKANRLDRAFGKFKTEYEQKALEVLNKGSFILGEEVNAFEKEFAEFTGTKYCVSLASGFDSLWIPINILGISKGDEIIVQANTYIADMQAISVNGATPVFIEPKDGFLMTADEIEKHITDKTKAVIVTYLYGLVPEMDGIIALCKKHGIKLIEDCAQAHGSQYKGKMAGSLGDIGCFSFYPTKNLGAFGDGGAVVLNDIELAKKIRDFRNYGGKCSGLYISGANSRLDEIQAALLRVKLSHLEEYIKDGERIAARYTGKIKNNCITLPAPHEHTRCTWHQYVIRTKSRNSLKDYLSERGISTQIHYPEPFYLNEAVSHFGVKKGDFPITESLCNEILSLPSYYGMTEDEQDYIIDAINSWRNYE